MELIYKRADITDIELLTTTRIEVLRAANNTLKLLVEDARSRGIDAISLEATQMGRPLYEKFGFVKMNDEMEYPC